MKVFLSHSHADAPLATRVSEGLQKKGLDVWDPDVDLFPGDNWAAKVARALEESQAMVVLLTRNAVNSSHVKREMAYALGEKRFSNRLIPVFVGDRAGLPTHDIPWIIRRMPRVELDDLGNEDTQIDRIANAIRIAA